MEILRRLTAAMLVLVMVVTMLPVSALADETVGDDAHIAPETAETESAETVETVAPDGPEAAETEAVETVAETTASTEAVETVPETSPCEETWEIPEVITGETEKEINTAPKRNASRLLTEIRVYDELRNISEKHVYNYNEQNYLTSIVSNYYGSYPYENITSLTYDSEGRLCSFERSFSNLYCGFIYNDAGQLDSVSYAGLGWYTENFEYDALGNCIRKTVEDDNNYSYSPITEYNYNEKNQLISTEETCFDQWSGESWINRKVFDYLYPPFVVVNEESHGYTSCCIELQINNGVSFDSHRFLNPHPVFYNDEDGYLAKVIDTNESAGNTKTTTYEFYYDGELAQPVEDDEPIDTELTWNQLYYEFIVRDKIGSEYSDFRDRVRYELIYLDGDVIPELWIDYNAYAAGCRIVTVSENELYEEHLGYGSLSYVEYKNVFNHSYGHQGSYSDTIYKIEDGGLVPVAEGHYVAQGEWNSNVFQYKWDGQIVSEQAYTQKINEYIDPELALKTGSDSSVVFDYDGILEWLKNYKIEEEETEADNSLIVFSDYSNLSICTNAIITLGVGIQKNGDVQSDLSGIAFQIADNTVLDVVITDYEDNFFYVKLRGLKAGNTTVTFSDSDTGETVAVPVSVSNRKVHSYALNDIPEKEMDGFPANFYNINGLYIDSYKYSVNDDQSANVSFDVYNSNYSYGVVEIYKENGEIHGVVLIDKAISSTTGFKEVLWDGVRYCIRDFANKTAFTYRQESGFSKKTPINIKIPKNGYIKICSDPAESLICGVVNAVDILMQLKSIKDELKDYGEHCFVFYKELTSKMLADETYALLLKDGSKAAEKFWKNVGKEIFISSDFMENTAMSIAKNIEELDLGNLIAETASDFGWDIGTDVFVHLAGPAGDAIKLVFAMGKTIDLLIEFTDLTQAIGGIKIYIQNQGGGVLSAQQIKVESQTDFPDKTALNVFQVTLDSFVLDAIKKASPELYEAVTNGKTYTYNISLLCSGKESQPDSPVTVYIPIPEDLKLLALAKKVKVYRTEEDGTMTEMNTKIQDGCFVFTTDHFSLYTIVGYDSFAPDNHDFSLGDVNHDTKINAKDATLILQKSVGVLKPTAKFCEECAEVSGDGKLNAKDSTLILQFSVGLRDSFPAGA